MGSQGRKRGRRTLSDEGGRRADITRGLVVPAYEHNQWTFEGEIERLGEFSRGASRASGWKRVVALVVAVALLAPVGIALVTIAVAQLH